MENYKSKNNASSKGILKIFFLLLFFVVAYLLYKRYSFTYEHIDLFNYIGVEGNDVAIYINDVKQKIDNNDKRTVGFCYNDVCYLPMSFVKSKLNARFYFAKDVNRILYTTPEGTMSYGQEDMHQVGNAPYVLFRDEPYLLLEFIKDYTNIRYDEYLFENSKRVYIYTDWDKEAVAVLKGRESLRISGGNKSLVVTNLKKSEEVKILEKMTKWAKVKSQNGYIGYLRLSKLKNESSVIPMSTFKERIREKKVLSNKAVLGFHQVLSIYSSSGLNDLLKNAKDMNIIAPTWYVIKNNDGDIRSVANAAYTQSCHNKGMMVWATLNNFDLEDINEKTVFSSALIRKKMIDKILREIDVNYLDGINLDIEDVSQDAAEDYIQFIRELSVELTKRKIYLSVDTYIPFAYNKHYNIKEIAQFADFVVLMCYDEHHSGSQTAGSVSSLNFVKNGIELALKEVDKDKLIVALPYYSRIWTTTPEGKVSSSAYGSQVCESTAISQGLKFKFDETTGQNYGTKTTLTGSVVECWLEDEVSLSLKMEEVKKYDVAGTAAWKLTQERSNFFSIINLNKK